METYPKLVHFAKLFLRLGGRGLIQILLSIFPFSVLCSFNSVIASTILSKKLNENMRVVSQLLNNYSRKIIWRILWLITICLLTLLIHRETKFISYHDRKYKNRILWNDDVVTKRLYDPFDTSIFNESSQPRRVSTKYILVYTKFFGSKEWKFIKPSNNFKDHRKSCACNIDMCEFIFDKAKFNISDIVVFHGKKLDMPHITTLNELNRHRPKNQLWLYFTLENPVRSMSPEPYNHLFNLTSTYRLDSDLRIPYRYHFPRERYPFALNRNNKVLFKRNYAENKSGQIIWAASSSCKSRRNLLAEKLHQYGLNIEKYGKCRVGSIPQTKDTNYKGYPSALPYNKYKFVLAFENSFCTDYITEKYWKNGIDFDTVPIVLGGANYSDERLAIPGSYIDALKFPSAKKLAEYLRLVDGNDTLYNEYFRWKRDWSFYDTGRSTQCFLWSCELCRKLHTGDWTLKKEPLTSTINATRECSTISSKYDKWIQQE